jgi:glucosyl-3-phosphoglycerate synthase
MNVPDRRSIPPASELATRWTSRRSFSSDQLPDARALATLKQMHGSRISVGVVAPDGSSVRANVADIASRLMDDIALIDELTVFRTIPATEPPAPASATGVAVVNVAELMPEIPRADGRGDILWRSLTAMRGDIVVWLDGDAAFQQHAVPRLVGPLLTDPTIGLVRGYDSSAGEFEVEIDGIVHLAGGARVNELVTRPLLNILIPELGGVFQPLRGPSAGRASVLRQIPFLSGCSVDVAMVIDVFQLIGLDGLAQVDIGMIVRGSRPLDELGPEAHAITRTILKRAEECNRLKLAPTARAHPMLVRSGLSVNPARIDEIERPPIDVVPPYLAALRSSGSNGDGRYAGVRGSS